MTNPAMKYRLDLYHTGSGWMPYVYFYEGLVEQFQDFIAALLCDPSIGAEEAAIIDCSTGEVIWDSAMEEEEPFDDCDNDMGFDPYIGCYSYDC